VGHIVLNGICIHGKPEFGRKTKTSIEIAAGFGVWVRIIGENSTDTQLILSHICLHPHTLALAPDHNPTLKILSLDEN
jgi:hypothetical protein